MATAAPIMGAPTGATNILPFKRPDRAPAFAPGVVPFDCGNPDHVRAWNSLFAFARG